MDYKILIAEDEPKLRELLADYFMSKGERVTAVEDGIRAMRRMITVTAGR